MTSRPLCQPLMRPEARIAAERNRRFWEGTAYTPQHMRIANATTSTTEPWVLFTPPAEHKSGRNELLWVLYVSAAANELEEITRTLPGLLNDVEEFENETLL